VCSADPARAESSDDEDDANSDDSDDQAVPTLRKLTTDEDKRAALDVIVEAFNAHDVAMEEEGFFYTIEGDANPDLSWDKEILLPKYEVYMYGDTVGVVLELNDSFAVLHLIGSTRKGDGLTALQTLLGDLAKKKTLAITLEAIDGATTGQKVVDFYEAAGFETIGFGSRLRARVFKTSGDWETTVAKLLTHARVEDDAALRAWANNVAALAHPLSTGTAPALPQPAVDASARCQRHHR
jgi:hypothetical protein